MKKLIFVLLASLMFISQGANSAGRPIDKIFAECGIGAMILPENATGAAIINFIWDSGTTATSSDVSSDDMCKGSAANAVAFIYGNYPSVEMDLAQGQGKYLDALVSIADCGAQTEVVSNMRTDFGKMVSDANYVSMSRVEKTDALYSIYEGNLNKASCSLN